MSLTWRPAETGNHFLPRSTDRMVNEEVDLVERDAGHQHGVVLLSTVTACTTNVLQLTSWRVARATCCALGLGCCGWRWWYVHSVWGLTAMERLTSAKIISHIEWQMSGVGSMWLGWKADWPMGGGVSKVHYDALLRAGHRPVRYCSVRVFAQDGIEIAVDYRSQKAVGAIGFSSIACTQWWTACMCSSCVQLQQAVEYLVESGSSSHIYSGLTLKFGCQLWVDDMAFRSALGIRE